MNYSVLMSVYAKEKPEYLKEAMESMWNQTMPTDNFVLVCDGPLTEELDAVIEQMKQKHTKELHVIRLEENQGLGKALNIGLKKCRNELVARMDSDDISRKDRCERQLRVYEERPDISIVSGTIEEFYETKEKIEAKRVLPENQKEILKFARYRNPFNHMAVMYKKSAVEAVGSYQDFFLLEDYFLWIRMLNAGCIAYNTKEPLVWARTGKGMYHRRGGRKYFQSQKALFKYMRSEHMIDSFGYLRSVSSRFINALMPSEWKECIYKCFLRER